MRIVITDGIEMAELSAEEHAFLDARIASLEGGNSRIYTEEEIEEIIRQQDLEERTKAHDSRNPA